MTTTLPHTNDNDETEAKTKKVLLYGAYGHSAVQALELLYSEKFDSLREKIDLSLGGRNRRKLLDVARRFKIKNIISFAGPSSFSGKNFLSRFDILINCAGPFKYTLPWLAPAAIKGGCHYLDINGEIDVFLTAYALAHEARENGVILCPGIGFDVIPTDCLASQLKKRLPEANELTLAFATDSPLSRGTFKTTLEVLKEGIARREGGQIKWSKSTQFKNIDIAGEGEISTVECFSIPWGDLATAYFSSNIDNISVFIPSKSSFVRYFLKSELAFLNSVTSTLKFLGPLLSRALFFSRPGPDRKTQEDFPTKIYGAVKGPSGTVVEGRFETPNGYTVTAEGILRSLQHLVNNDFANSVDSKIPLSGFFTPSQLFGEHFIEEFSSTSKIEFREIKGKN